MISEKTFSLMQKMLDFYAARHRVIAHNIANADVKGFKPQQLQFADELQSLLARGSARDIAQAEFRLVQDPAPTHGGKIDVERQMALLVKNNLLFGTFAQATGGRLRLLRSAIQGR